jgi:hypothetical protein
VTVRTPSPRLHLLLPLLIVAGVLIVDQATKMLARETLAGQPPILFVGGAARLLYAENPGAFLSLGADLPAEARFWIFSVLAALLQGQHAGAQHGRQPSGMTHGRRATVHLRAQTPAEWRQITASRQKSAQIRHNPSGQVTSQPVRFPAQVARGNCGHHLRQFAPCPASIRTRANSSPPAAAAITSGANAAISALEMPCV